MSSWNDRGKKNERKENVLVHGQVHVVHVVVKELVRCGSMSEVMRLAVDISVWRSNVNLDPALR